MLLDIKMVKMSKLMKLSTWSKHIRLNQNTLLLSIKVIIFAFIITSPFYNVGATFSVFDNIFAKVLLLGLVIVASFVDMQLAIIMAIALFIMLMSINNEVINKAKPETKQAVASNAKLDTQPTVSMEDVNEQLHATPAHAMQVPLPAPAAAHFSSVAPYVHEEGANEATKSDMNQTIIGYYLDNRIKPYEDLITQITSKQLLDSVSTSAVLP